MKSPTIDEYRDALRECVEQMHRVNMDEKFKAIRDAAEALVADPEKENDDGR